MIAEVMNRNLGILDHAFSEEHASKVETINGDGDKNSSQNATTVDGFLSPSGQYVSILL